MAYGVSLSLFGSVPACATGSQLHRGNHQLQGTTCQATIGEGHVLLSPIGHQGLGEG